VTPDFCSTNNELARDYPNFTAAFDQLAVADAIYTLGDVFADLQGMQAGAPAGLQDYVANVWDQVATLKTGLDNLDLGVIAQVDTILATVRDNMAALQDAAADECGTVTPAAPNPDQLRLSRSVWATRGVAGSVTERVLAGPAWTATASADWITVSQTSGTGAAKLTVSVTANPGAARTGSVTFAAVDGSSSRTLTVEQQAGQPFVVATPAGRWNVLAAGGEQVYTVATNQAGWTATSNAAWLTVAPASGAPQGQLVLTAAANPGAVRSAKVTVTAGSVTTTITVRQVAGPKITLNRHRVSISGVNDLEAVRVTTNTGSWTAVADQPWVHLSVDTGKSGTVTVVSADANDTGAVRTATVTFSAADGQVVDTLTVREK
jgi:hypothetical protein